MARGHAKTIRLGQRLAQPVAVAVIILFGKKTGLAIVTALDDVQRHAVKMDAWAAGIFSGPLSR